jgi:hypothetical protein
MRGRVTTVIIQLAKRMRHIILSSVTCLAVPHFLALPHKTIFWGEKFIEQNVCFDFLHKFA